LLAVIGCQTLHAPAPEPAPPLVATNQDQAVLPAAAAEAAPTEPADRLTLYTECMGRGDQPAAAAHLDAYVRAHPDQLMFRAHLAELLLRLGRPTDARAQFEQFVADAQAATGPPREHLVHCHTRLMEIGQRADDRFAELFHRGVGLVLLAKDADGEVGEEIVCRAIAALTAAKELRPADPRVCLYLADAHDRAGNRRAADVCRAAARNRSTPGSLTPCEQRSLAVRAEVR
jgi:predicted Zn-dependent protease